MRLKPWEEMRVSMLGSASKESAAEGLSSAPRLLVSERWCGTKLGALGGREGTSGGKDLGRERWKLQEGVLLMAFPKSCCHQAK